MTEVQERSGEAEGDRRESAEHQVLAIIDALARELNPRRPVKPTPGASLQRDLGFDSLGLAELLLRTEKQFQIRLPDDLITRLETASDLIGEVARADTRSSEAFARKPAHVAPALVETVPDEAATLGEVLHWHLEHNADRPHILLSDGYQETETITYRGLAETAGALAAGLRSWGLEPGERVSIMLPTGREFFDAFFGTLLAGGVPVPMYPPIRLSQLEEHLRRQAAILRNAGSSLLIISDEGKALSALLGAQIDTLRGVATVEDLRAKGETAFVPRRGQDLAMLQYTSGTTGNPKGVMLTHANLLANVRAMGSSIDATANDVFISWLPLYHDLGLIGAWLACLYHAVPTVIMSPLRFIVRPESWLWAIHRNSGTLSAAPNFAYELCVKRIEESALEGLDLSSLRMVANGAEAVSAETIRRFTERFEPYGFKPEALTPVYGLAESSVGLAFSSPLARPIIEKIDRKVLSQTGKAVAARADDPHPRTVVACGTPLAGHEVRIVDDLGREVGERQQGRLEFIGPSTTAGYFRNSEKTRALFRDGWLQSGDLAFIANGNIFITGRIKDIIIKGGRNIYPEEIEEAVGDLPGIRKGCVAAFAHVDPGTGTERLVVVAESRETGEEARARLQQAVNETVVDILGMPADDVVLAPALAVPKTSSGKIRRSSTQELYETGQLGKPVRALWLQVVRLGLMSGLPRLRRVLKALADIAYAAWWWVVLVGMGALAWAGVLVLPNRRVRWAYLRVMARTVLRLMGHKLEVSGAANFEKPAGVFAVNHSSYLDVAVLAAVLPGEPVFVAKHELASQRVAGPFLRRLGARFAMRDVAEQGLKEVEAFKHAVSAGERLVIFPEATFFRMPGLLAFRLGAFTIAAATETSVLPVVLKGTRSILRSGQWFPRRGSVHVEVLEPIAPDGHDFSAIVHLRDRVREQVLSRCGEPDMAEKEVMFENDGETRPDD